MIQFEREQVDAFLSVVRKYMQLRGGLSQKDLAEQTDTGISTMSRFLNQKTKDLDEQLIAKIVAFLEVPLHEMIDFVFEEDVDKFKRLVAFYRGEDQGGGDYDGGSRSTFSTTIRHGGKRTKMAYSAEKRVEGPLRDRLERLSPRQKAYLHDFLELDVEGRDLIVDLGNALFRYFKQRGLEF